MSSRFRCLLREKESLLENILEIRGDRAIMPWTFFKENLKSYKKRFVQNCSISLNFRDICEKFSKKVLQSTGLPELNLVPHLSLKFNKFTNKFTCELPLLTKSYDLREKSESLTSEAPGHELFTRISREKRKNHEILSFDLNRDAFVKEILENNITKITPPLITGNKKIIVEFSSPNIAKPFHVGHLRSTIIGNYISNLQKYLNNNVVKLNYLGDWGTQLGFVMLGMDLLNLKLEEIQEKPMKQLYEAYVHANKLAETDPSILERAKDIFQKLENGDSDKLKKWENFRDLTVDELKKTYERIGIIFDDYNWESSYSFKRIGDVIDHMEQMKMLKIDECGGKIVDINENKKLPIIKSDGSTLYISRDIAAAIDRIDRYNFDEMYYVVGNEQHDHFNNLFIILDRMKLIGMSKLRHLKFGRIMGMSTRQGNAIFLRDILDEAKISMREQQKNSLTTKVELADETSADILGISAVIIHDLKQKRTRDYKFSWDVALDIKGETGVKLQYTHCRLSGIEDNSCIIIPNECIPSLLSEPIVNDLVGALSQFDEAIVLSYETLESCYLAKYLFNLSHTVNKTIKELRVKDESSDIAAQRLLLYRSAKNVLNTGMKLLGLKPLNKM